MIEITITYTRSNADVPFYTKDPNFLDLLTARYGDKRLYAEKTLSDDSLTLTQKAIWTSLEDFDAYENDPEFEGFLEARHEHHIKHNIVCVRSIKNLDL